MKTSREIILKLTALPVLLFSLTLNTEAFFDPTIGRWASRDPIEERGGNNLYRFALNNPVSFADRLGLIVIYVGGAMEGTLKIDKNLTQLEYFQRLVGADVAYERNGKQKILALISQTIANNPCEPIILIGHSWGGATAADVAVALKKEKCLLCLHLITLDPVSHIDTKAWFGGPRLGENTEWINIAQPAGPIDAIADIPVAGWIIGGVVAGASAPFGSDNGIATGGGQWNSESKADIDIPSIDENGKTIRHHDVDSMMNLKMPGQDISVKRYVDELRRKDCCK